MADDGMILNFAPGESLPTSYRKPKFEGGSWKDRARAKRRAQGTSRRVEDVKRLDKAISQSSANHVAVRKVQQADSSDPRAPKRRKQNNYTDGNAGSGHRSGVPRKNEQQKQSADRDVVSSLFTSNPTPSHPIPQSEDAESEDKSSKPSNAPLVDGIDTFTSLGLSSVIAAHLLTKMDLKNPTAIQKAAISQMLKEEGDAFIQSETGSGKTLAYLLPVVQRMMQMREQQRNGLNGTKGAALHRDSGLFAIVLAPTRELCKQISVVLERLLGCAHYIVAGTVIGGEKKKSEKARLRKGLNILVATPGRLVDHLDNTAALDVSSVRWLVLDEGDRLMDLGFEQDLTKIITTLDKKQITSGRNGLPEKRMTILCSATLKMNVQKLGEISLKNAALIKVEADDAPIPTDTTDTNETKHSLFLAPAQLKQSYMVVPSKLRLVTLTALLRRTFARKGSVNKAIVFLSCADSVDFHHKVFTRPTTSSGSEDNPKPIDESSSSSVEPPTSSDHHSSIAPSPMLSSSATPLQLYKLHGSLPQPTRTTIITHFRTATQPSLLLATDVASRGLDLPNLDLVIEYDPAFSTDDHLHRIGRTARLGRDGRAVVFLLPGKEEGYVDVLKKSYKPSSEGIGAGNVSQSDATETLRKGFTPTTGIVSTSHREWEARATDFQLDVERWVLGEPGNRELAKRAFQSHVRAYATHVAGERKWFDIKELHLGHLAKAFGLREAPGRMNVMGMRSGDTRGGKRGNNAEKSRKGIDGNDENADKGGDGAAKKMRDMIRKQKMMTGVGADEFNIA